MLTMKSGGTRLRVARSVQAVARCTLGGRPSTSPARHMPDRGGRVSIAVTRAADPRQRRQEPRPSFASDVAPILNEHCVMCHRPGGRAPFSLVTLDDARAKAERIVEVTRARQMPPWTAHAGPRLSGAAERSDGSATVRSRTLQQVDERGNARRRSRLAHRCRPSFSDGLGHWACPTSS